MDQFVIQGSKKLRGEIDARGAKNAAFPLLAATLLTKEDCVIRNLPLIEDVHRTIEILQSMGAKVDWIGERAVKINTKNADPKKISKNLMIQLRGSVLFFGPLLGRFKKAALPQPGGCVIGARPIDTHLDAFSQLGVQIHPKGEGFDMEFSGTLKANQVILNEFSVTATENILLFASLLGKPVNIKVADLDYQVQELISVLRKMGVKVSLSGHHAIVVKGKKQLRGFDHFLMYDPIEAGTFILLALASKGMISVKNVELQFLELFLKKLKDFGASLEITKDAKGRGTVKVMPSTLFIDKIQSFIYPGIHSDLQSPLGVLATQTRGSTLLHDPLYEGRLKYLEELVKMGAEIYFADPHRALINGPTKLYGTNLGTFDLRGGAALIIAALIAEGKSTIQNAYQVDRGYEKIEERLQKLGADIKRVKKP
ncbi:MAG: UDP-N-acetylglucosamine 1-carboxyvinyltransferase [Candidatus Wildermuthbacteria bacterium]|nr:UDP-N-acetylglucosamine 1-carboxyvinyltransferase [Candidatus Wildermuthbacteria bacterium]